MDLSKYEAKGTFTLQLRDPATNEPLEDEIGPVTVEIVGVDSPEFAAQRRQIANKRLAAAGNRKAKLTAVDLEEEGIATLAACMKGWSKNIDLGDGPLEFSRSNAKLFLERLPAFKEQIDEAIADRANFLKASPKS